MKYNKLNLNDFEPKEANFKLKSTGDKIYTLCAFSLRVRAWAEEQYSEKEMADIFTRQDVVKLAKIAWFMLKDKTVFNNSEIEFFDAIRTMRDGFNVMLAVFEAVGTAQPELDKLNAEIDKAMLPKNRAERRSTGAKSTTR